MQQEALMCLEQQMQAMYPFIVHGAWRGTGEQQLQQVNIHRAPEHSEVRLRTLPKPPCGGVKPVSF